MGKSKETPESSLHSKNQKAVTSFLGLTAAGASLVASFMRQTLFNYLQVVTLTRHRLHITKSAVLFLSLLMVALIKRCLLLKCVLAHMTFKKMCSYARHITRFLLLAKCLPGGLGFLVWRRGLFSSRRLGDLDLLWRCGLLWLVGSQQNYKRQKSKSRRRMMPS